MGNAERPSKRGLVGTALGALPVLELLAIFVSVSALGFLNTLILFVALFALGSWFFRYRLAALAQSATRAMGATSSTGAARAAPVTSDILALVGAGLLLVPGLLTGFAGLALQVGPLRRIIAPRLTGSFGSVVGSVGTRFAPRGDVIDVDVVTSDSTDTRPSTSARELT